MPSNREVPPWLWNRPPDMEVPSRFPLLGRWHLHQGGQQDAVADVVEEEGKAAVEIEDDLGKVSKCCVRKCMLFFTAN